MRSCPAAIAVLGCRARPVQGDHLPRWQVRHRRTRQPVRPRWSTRRGESASLPIAATKLVGVEGGRVGSHMTRFVVDCGVVVRLASEGIEVLGEHELLAPSLLRSQTLSALHEAVHRGEIPPEVALDRLTRIRALPIRLLGDAVLRRRAWELADLLGWAETYDAEYIALTQLQADAFVTLDSELVRQVEGVVPTATIEALAGPA